MVQAVVFDIDGTLIDSVDLHAEAWQSAFRKFGKTVRFAEVRLQIGKGADQLLPVFFSPEEMAKFGQELEDYRSELYKKEYLPHVKAFPKVRELFERIRQDRKSIALASSAKGDELNTYKKVVRIEDLIEAETSSDDAEKSKPYPDIFDAALADLRTIGLLCGGWNENDLRGAGCIAIYRDPAELLARYEQSPTHARLDNLRRPSSIVCYIPNGLKQQVEAIFPPARPFSKTR